MIRFRQLRRLAGIASVLAKYRLEDILANTSLSRMAKAIAWVQPWRAKATDEPLGRRLRMALDDLGPIFVKLGQMLSTRRDLLPKDIADELAMLQDQVAPFPGDQARAAVEKALGEPISEVFAKFEDNALASASVAQVHAAELKNGDKVVVKVLRPGIAKKVRRDLELITIIAGMADRYWAAAAHVRPLELVAELAGTLKNELNLQREAANASQLKRNFADDRELYVPAIYWDYTHKQVMVMERVYGIPIDNVDELRGAGVDMKLLAERGNRIFYTQVFRDNFFHADMHPGNILVDVTDPKDPTYIALDFGIVGSMPSEHLHYLAENFLAFFNQDYRRVAALHIEAGWIPATSRIDQVESAVRAVCEPQLAKPLSEISFAQVLFQLFDVARQFELTAQPELILLQKTLLNIEGVGRQVYPELDIWTTSKPVMEKIMADRLGVDAAAKDLQQRLPAWMARTPKVPGLVFDYLEKVNAGRLETRLKSDDLKAIRDLIEQRSNNTAWAVFAAGFALMATMVGLFGNPETRVLGQPLWPSVSAVAALWCAWKAITRQ
ncbi:MAG: ubiquinone biosynthesis regulatory protein kinase UbiB [Lysobacterales bacterium]